MCRALGNTAETKLGIKMSPPHPPLSLRSPGGAPWPTCWAEPGARGQWGPLVQPKKGTQGPWSEEHPAEERAMEGRGIGHEPLPGPFPHTSTLTHHINNMKCMPLNKVCV